MRKNIIKLCLLALFQAVLYGCDTADVATEKSKKIDLLVKSSVSVVSVAEVGNNLALLSKQGGSTYFENKTNKIKSLVTEESVRQNGVWLHRNKHKIYALWWLKTKEGKKLKIKVSADGGKTFNNESYIAKKGVLPSLSIADDGNDKIAVAYLSEREPGYQIYFNRSIDAGKTWFKDDLRINALYDSKGVVAANDPLLEKSGRSHTSPPFLTYIDNKLIVVYQERSVLNEKVYLRIVSKVSLDDGLTWSKENEIYARESTKPQEMHVAKLNNELFVSVDIPKVGMLPFMSSAKGSKWNASAPLSVSKQVTSRSYMRSARVADAVFLSFVESSKTGKDKVKIYIKQGDVWSDISATVIVRNKLDANTPDDVKTKETLPVVQSFNNNLVVVAWEDYRNLIPSVYINYSTDAGKTWQKEAITLGVKGRDITKFPEFIVADKSLWLTLTYINTDNNKEPQGLYVAKVAEISSDAKLKVNLEKSIKKSELSALEKEKLLKKRSKEFWGHRVKEEYAKTYKYFDPLYRTTFSKANFVASQGKIRFLASTTGDVSMYGNIAFVKTKIKFTISIFAKAGILNEAVPPQDREIDSRWGWFNGNWYLMPETLFDQRYKF